MINLKTFQLYFHHTEIENFITKTLTFSGGEVLIQTNHEALQNACSFVLVSTSHLKLVARIQSSEDAVGLFMVVDILRRYFENRPIDLILPYIPYARQDRVCNPGEAHSLKVFAGMINSLNFARVIVVDPHSAVSEAVIDRITVVQQKQTISEHLVKIIEKEDAVFVAPDAGANKKTSDLAKEYMIPFIRCDKLRDLQTGKIIETVVYADTLKGKTCIIVDDICDGGRTFVELAKALRAKGAKKVILSVSHGIFSNGTKYLEDNGIDEIYTTNTFRSTPDSDNVIVVDLTTLLLAQ